MKKLVIVLIICVIAIAVIFFLMHRKIDALQDSYDNLSKQVSDLNQTFYDHTVTEEPLSTSEVETFQHNIDVLNEFYGVQSTRPVAIANKCLSLKRSGNIDSAWIVDIEEHDIPSKSYYCLEIVTEDEEHYWFRFAYDSNFIYAIHKGENKETLLYAVVDHIE